MSFTVPPVPQDEPGIAVPAFDAGEAAEILALVAGLLTAEPETLGLTAAKVRAPEQADRWVRLVMAAHAELLLARPLAGDLRRPWEKHPDPARPLTPGRVRRGYRNIRRELGTPARVAKPSRPGPGRPKGSSKGPALRCLLPGEADMPRTAKPALTREKIKT
jgi:hypothetical protein